MQTYIILKQPLLIGAAMFFVGCHGQRPYPAHSDKTSGSLVAAAGSIGIVALAASAALTAMSSLQISKDCYFKKSTQENTQKTTQGTTQEPEESCNDILAVEKQRFEEEKEELKRTLQEAQGALEFLGKTIRAHCGRYAPASGQADCITCAELLGDETACLNNNKCDFNSINGVCVIA